MEVHWNNSFLHLNYSDSTAFEITSKLIQILHRKVIDLAARCAINIAMKALPILTVKNQLIYIYWPFILTSWAIFLCLYFFIWRSDLKIRFEDQSKTCQNSRFLNFSTLAPKNKFFLVPNIIFYGLSGHSSHFFSKTARNPRFT